MVNQIIFIIKDYTLRISLWLFLTIFSLFFLSLIIYYFEILVRVIRASAKKRITKRVYDYLIGKIGLDELYYRKIQQNMLINSFTTTIALITGTRQKYLKNAVVELGLVETITKKSSSLLPSKRIYTCYLLGLLGLKKYMKFCTKALKDHNPRVVSSAIIALGEIREKDTIPAILNFFAVCSAAHAWLIAAILPFFGSVTYPFIKPYFRPHLLPPEKLVLLVKIVTNFKLTESTAELITLYTTEENLDVKINALMALGKINDLSSIKLVLDALRDPQWQIRAVAANIIGSMALKGSVWRLLPLIKDKNWYVRKNAAHALVKIGKIGIHTLITYLEIDDRYARDMIVQTLEEHGIVARAIQQLNSDVVQEKNEAVKIITALIQKGYTKYLKNFTVSNTLLAHIFSEEERKNK